MKRLFLFFTFISSLFILYVYLGVELYRANLIVFVVSFILLQFLLDFKKVISLFERYEKIFFCSIIAFSILILLRAGIVDVGIISIQDYPIHYFVHNLMAEKILPLYKSTNGMYLNYQLGYSPLYDHPPGGPLLTSFLYYITLKKIPFWLIFRLVVAIGFLLPLISIYILSKELGFHPFISILSLLFWLAWFHEYYIDGTFISYYSLSFGLLSISFFFHFLKHKEGKNVLASSIFLALSLLFQSMLYPFFLFSLFTLSIMKRKIKQFLLLIILSTILGLTYFASVLSWEYTFQIFEKQSEEFPHMYDINRSFWLHFYVLSCYPILISLPLILLKVKKEIGQKLNYLLIIFLSLIFISFILHFLQTKVNITFLNLISRFFLIERVVFINRVFFSFLASFAVYTILKNSKKNNIATILIVSLMLTNFSTFFRYLFEAWYDDESRLFEYIYGWKPRDWYSQEFKDGILKNRPKSDVVELFSFLKEKTSKNARIIVEDSRWGKLGGNIMALLSYSTSRYFAGGLYQGIFIEGDTLFVDGKIFGKRILDYSPYELANKLEEYNIKWIVVWTNESKGYFSNFSIFSKIYETSNGLFQVYEYNLLEENYVKVMNGNGEVEIVNDNYIILNLFNVKGGDDIKIKFRYEKYWRAYFNGEEIPIRKCGILMCIKSPKDGNYRVILKFENSKVLMLANLISLISFLLLTFLYLFYQHIFYPIRLKQYGFWIKRK